MAVEMVQVQYFFNSPIYKKTRYNYRQILETQLILGIYLNNEKASFEE